RIKFFAFDLVTHADWHLVQHVEHVHLGDHPPVHAVDHLCITQERQVNPAAAPRTPGNCAVFIAASTKLVSNGALNFAGKWAAANARAIRLGYADHVLD